jgi:UDP-glucose 4-epimerase
MAMRVLLTGVGSELGWQVATLLEADPAVEGIVGMDLERPRRRLRRTTLHLADPRERRRILPVVREFEPTAIVHLGTWEPDARSNPQVAAARTSAGSMAVLGAAAELPGLDRIVVRSGIEVYGRSRGSASVPDESVPPLPTSAWGRSLLGVERLAAAAGLVGDVPVATLRFAPIVGARHPSPLGRYLRLPVVGFSALADPPFSVVEVEEAARVVVAALHRRPDGALNVVSAGAVTVAQSALIGRRVPWPVFGPEVAVLRRLSAVPEHLGELIHRGRTADGSQAQVALGVELSRTPDVIRQLYGWTPPADLKLLEGAA